jgi:hypothetical protein
MKIVQSRNKREGEYAGKFRGEHFRNWVVIYSLSFEAALAFLKRYRDKKLSAV